MEPSFKLSGALGPLSLAMSPTGRTIATNLRFQALQLLLYLCGRAQGLPKAIVEAEEPLIGWAGVGTSKQVDTPLHHQTEWSKEQEWYDYFLKFYYFQRTMTLEGLTYRKVVRRPTKQVQDIRLSPQIPGHNLQSFCGLFAPCLCLLELQSGHLTSWASVSICYHWPLPSRKSLYGNPMQLVIMGIINSIVPSYQFFHAILCFHTFI